MVLFWGGGRVVRETGWSGVDVAVVRGRSVDVVRDWLYLESGWVFRRRFTRDVLKCDVTYSD